MTTSIDPIETLAASYQLPDAAIAAMSEEYLPLKIDGLHDKVGAVMVHEARMDVKRKRIDIEKTRKGLKRDALDWGRTVDEEAKRLTELLAPIEAHLLAEEKVIIDEKARVKREAEEARAATLKTRMDLLAIQESTLAADKVERMTEDEFEEALGTAADELDARMMRDAQAKVDAKRLAEEKAQLACDREELAREKAAFAVEREEPKASLGEEEHAPPPSTPEEMAAALPEKVGKVIDEVFDAPLAVEGSDPYEAVLTVSSVNGDALDITIDANDAHLEIAYQHRQLLPIRIHRDHVGTLARWLEARS